MKILDKIEEYICAVCTVVMTLLVFAPPTCLFC